MSKRKHKTWVVWAKNRWMKNYIPGAPGRTIWRPWRKWKRIMAFTIYGETEDYYTPSARDEARKWAQKKFSSYENERYKVLPEGREPK